MKLKTIYCMTLVDIIKEPFIYLEPKGGNETQDDLLYDVS